jgi:tRNA(fMet)-specific endonuclease VapC
VRSFLLDSTTFSFLMERRAEVVTHMGSVGPADRVAVCTIVRGEILYGLERMPPGHRRRENERAAAELFEVLPCDGLPEAVADAYARIKYDAERKGTQLAENDLWIAATALAQGATVVTSDADFGRVRGLGTEDWTT